VILYGYRKQAVCEQMLRTVVCRRHSNYRYQSVFVCSSL